MKHLLPCTLRILLALTPFACHAVTHCPANIPSLHPRIVAGALLVIPVKINQSGPYDFMIDTGSELNIVDPALAAQLALRPQGSVVHLVIISNVFLASLVLLDSLEIGPQSVANAIAAVQDLGPIQAADPRIRGVLGEKFLAHYDVLIDYRRRLVCLDEAKVMGRELSGERIPLVRSRDPEDQDLFSPRLVISVYLSDTADQDNHADHYVVLNPR